MGKRLFIMRNGAIIFVLFALTGCANFQEVVNTVPEAVGVVVAAEVFGGEVSMVPDPVEYVTRDVEREGRITYNSAQRNTKAAISDAIINLFNTTK